MARARSTQARDDRRVDRRTRPRRCGASASVEHGDVGDALLEQVARPAPGAARAGASRSATRGSARARARRRRDATSRISLRGDEALVGVRRRHLDVDDRDVGPRQLDLAHAARPPLPTLPTTSKPASVEQPRRAPRAAAPRRRRSRPARDLRSDRDALAAASHDRDACRRARRRGPRARRLVRGALPAVDLDHEPPVAPRGCDLEPPAGLAPERLGDDEVARPPRRRSRARSSGSDVSPSCAGDSSASASSAAASPSSASTAG